MSEGGSYRKALALGTLERCGVTLEISTPDRAIGVPGGVDFSYDARRCGASGLARYGAFEIGTHAAVQIRDLG